MSLIEVLSHLHNSQSVYETPISPEKSVGSVDVDTERTVI